jgi:hypothetical protein
VTTLLTLTGPAEAHVEAWPTTRPTARDSGSCLLVSKFESSGEEADGGAAAPDADGTDNRPTATTELPGLPDRRQLALFKWSPSVSLADTRLGGSGPCHGLRTEPELTAGPATPPEVQTCGATGTQGDN